MRITPYVHVHDLNGARGDGLQDSSIKYSATLAAGVPSTITVPGFARKWAIKIVIESGKDVWFSVNSTATVPAGGAFALTDSDLIPTDKEVIREVTEDQVLQFVTADTTADVSVVFYSLR